LNSLTVSVGFSISLCGSINFCLMYFESLLLGTYIFRVVSNNDESIPLSLKWTSCFLMTFFALKSTFSAICVASPFSLDCC
jgi:hypothetical protein